MKKQVVLSGMVAVLSSAATIGIWTSITPASAGGSKQAISGISFHDAYSPEVTVEPGDQTYAYADCPSGDHVVGGGYNMSGTDGLTVASAVKSYPSKVSSQPNSFGVEVVNPTAASGPVTFTVKAVCVSLSVTLLP